MHTKRKPMYKVPPTGAGGGCVYFWGRARRHFFVFISGVAARKRMQQQTRQSVLSNATHAHHHTRIAKRHRPTSHSFAVGISTGRGEEARFWLVATVVMVMIRWDVPRCNGREAPTR